MRPLRVTLLPIVTALFALTVPRLAAHTGSGIVVDQKGCIFFIDSGGDGFLWKIDPGAKRFLRSDSQSRHYKSFSCFQGSEPLGPRESKVACKYDLVFGRIVSPDRRRLTIAEH